MSRNISGAICLAFVIGARDTQDDSSATTHIVGGKYTLTKADYAAISDNDIHKTIAEESGTSAALERVQTDFSSSGDIPGNTYSPAFRSDKYAKAAVGSSVELTCNFRNKGDRLRSDVKVRYGNAERLSVWLSTGFDGSDLNTATWKELTANFPVHPKAPETGYGASVTSADSCRLSVYDRQTVRIAFEYTGDGAPKKTTAYQIDNSMTDKGNSIGGGWQNALAYAYRYDDDGNVNICRDKSAYHAAATRRELNPRVKEMTERFVRKDGTRKAKPHERA